MKFILYYKQNLTMGFIKMKNDFVAMDHIKPIFHQILWHVSIHVYEPQNMNVKCPTVFDHNA